METEKNISPELQNFIALHDLNIVQLLAIEDHILLKMDGFGYRMLLEVLDLRNRQ